MLYVSTSLSECELNFWVSFINIKRYIVLLNDISRSMVPVCQSILLGHFCKCENVFSLGEPNRVQIAGLYRLLVHSVMLDGVIS